MTIRDSAAEAEHPYEVTGFGVVHPWLCDAMGHLTTRNYVGFFDDATWHLLAELGHGVAAARAANWGWADVHNELDYSAELGVGSLVRISSRVTMLGRTSLTLESILQDRESGVIAARMIAKLVCFDLIARDARPLPDIIRQTAFTRFGAVVAAPAERKR